MSQEQDEQAIQETDLDVPGVNEPDDHEVEGEEVEGEVIVVEELDEETLERRRVALAQVLQWGDPVLRSPASPIAEFPPELAAEAERMISLMHDSLGVGLAATQLGALKRLLVYQAGPEAEPRALANPEVTWFSAETEVAEEGCLSLQGIAVDVERAVRIKVAAQDTQGTPVELEAEGLEARVIQHEVDHLEGVLILDRTVPEQRRGAVAALREGGTFEPADLLPDVPEGQEGGDVPDEALAGEEPAAF